MTTWYVDSISGNTSYSGRGFWGVGYNGADPVGTPPAVGETATGATSGSTALVAYVDSSEWSAGSGTIYFYSRSAAFNATTEQLNFSGGSHCHTTNAHRSSYDLTEASKQHCSEITFVAGDTVRLSDGGSSYRPVSIGSAVWTDESDTVYIGPTLYVSDGSCTNGDATVTSATGGFTAAMVGFPIRIGTSGTYTIASRTSTNEIELTATFSGTTGTYPLFVSTITKVIENCEAVGASADNVWANTGLPSGVTVTLGSTAYKQGSGSVNVAIAAAFGTGKAAWCEIPSTDYSSYTHSSFWIYQSGITSLAASYLRIDLCSDTTGDTVVDSFTIPYALPSARWLPISLAKDGGGSLGASIQSIALYVLTDVGATTVTLRLDNFFAHTGGFNLQSLISKHTNGTNEPWWGIRSIVGPEIRLGGSMEEGSQSVRYFCDPSDTTPETVESYYRNIIKHSTIGTSPTISVGTSGTSTARITVEGGYNTATGSRSGGITFMDGLTSSPYGCYGSALTGGYYDWSQLGIARTYTGFQNALNSTWTNCYHASGYYLGFSPGSGSILTNCHQSNCSVGGGGYWIAKDCKFMYNSGSLFATTGLFKMIDGIAVGTYLMAGVANAVSIVQLYNVKTYCPSGIMYLGQSYYPENQYVVSINDNRIEGVIKMAIGYGRGSQNAWLIESTTTAGTYRTASPGVKITPAVNSSSQRCTSHPFDEGVQVAVAANGNFTISVWAKRATAVAYPIRLVCRRNDIMGVTADTVIASYSGTDTADWHQISGTIEGAGINPTRDGVLEFVVDCYGTTSDFIYIDDWGVS